MEVVFFSLQNETFKRHTTGLKSTDEGENSFSSRM